MENIINAAQLIYKGNAMSKRKYKEDIQARRAVLAYYKALKLETKVICANIDLDYTTALKHIKKHNELMITSIEYENKFKLFMSIANQENKILMQKVKDIKKDLSKVEIELLKNLL